MFRNLNLYESIFQNYPVKIAFSFKLKGPLTKTLLENAINKIYQLQPTLQRVPVLDENEDENKEDKQKEKEYNSKKEIEENVQGYKTKNYKYKHFPFEESIQIEEIELDETNLEQWVEKANEVLKFLKDKPTDKVTRVYFFKNKNQEEKSEVIHTILVVVDHLYYDARSCLAFVGLLLKYLLDDKTKLEEKKETEKEKEKKVIKSLKPLDFNFHEKAFETQNSEEPVFTGFDFQKLPTLLNPIPDHNPPLEKEPESTELNEYGFVQGSKYQQLFFHLDEQTTLKFIQKCKQQSTTPFVVMTAILFAAINSFWHKGKGGNVIPGVFVDTRSHYDEPITDEYFCTAVWITELKERQIGEGTIFWDLVASMQTELNEQKEKKTVLTNLKYMAKSPIPIFGMPHCSCVNNYGCYEKIGYMPENGPFKLLDFTITGLEYLPLPLIQLSTYTVLNRIKICPLFSRKVFKQETIISFMQNCYLKILDKVINSEENFTLSQFNSNLL
ncbi:alcohol o-acetyltransferase 1-related [Anaeramoeba flamelloides]|uniref:Alcohol o-acetyltransferase 1-related n=1 Tax=Anaeramoeba flamelloides TaxID=1746091 RepID=A0AAV7ZQM1_9EUKA|nr:alcohol o-acetyltransferase 1-related [Anaeramoeba flamelloides]